MEQQPTQTAGKNGNRHSKIAGVVHMVNSTQLPQEFITIGKTFEEALGRCRIRDDNQKNFFILYKTQLEEFELTDEINELTSLLNASAAVGGFNISAAIMAHTGIYVPEGAGIKLGKEQYKQLMEAQRIRRKEREDKEDTANE